MLAGSGSAGHRDVRDGVAEAAVGVAVAAVFCECRCMHGYPFPPGVLPDHDRQAPSAGEQWAAVVGPVFSPAPTGVLTTPQDSGRRLAGTPILGGMRLVGVSAGLVEFYRDDPGSVNGVAEHVSWPVIAYGRDDLDESRHDVFRRLHSLAALLSLTWGGEAWQLRQAPLPAKDWRLAIPRSWAPPQLWPEKPWDRRDISVEEALPDRLQDWWDGAAGNGPARQALLAWHQAVLAADAHPSLALLGLTAAVEATAPLLAPDLARDASDSTKFKAALAVAASDEETKLLRRVYRDRGSTIHGGNLHGIEGLFGEDPWLAEDGPGWMTDPQIPEFAFVLRTLPRLIHVARRLVIAALQVA